MSKRLRRSMAILLTLFLTSSLCILMYFTDNKYKAEGLQAAEGILTVADGDLEAHPVSHLISGWALYPDKLLSPEDFLGGNPRTYMFYTFVGERTRFDSIGDKNDPHGCGSYFLRLNLPNEVQTYALELPEIYSAYKLYIGNRLVLQMGDPEAESYTPRTQNRMITFDASGSASILLSVSDYSHFYSGMVYPPAFGSPLALNTMRGIRLGIAMFVDTVSLLAAVLSLYFGLRLKHRSALLFSLTCVVMCVFTSYSLTHSVFALPIFPWYGLEIFSGYLLSLLVIIFHNRICDISNRVKKISMGVTGGVSLLALLYGLCGSLLTVPLMRAFSVLVLVFKSAFFLYLLATSILSLKRRNSRASPFFYAAVIYGTAFVWDRILPEFEPILSGWFIEWGSLALVAAISYTLWRDITTAYANNLAFAQERRLMTRQLTMQAEYARQVQAHSEENRRLIHDFRHHLHAITGIAANFSGDSPMESKRLLLDYLEQVSKSTSAAKSSLTGYFCENPAVNALLQYYSSVAEENHIETDFRIKLPNGLFLTDVELCTMLGNLLENAVDACKRRSNDSYIRISTKLTDRTLYLLVENSSDGSYRQIGSRFLSRKTISPRFGIGLQSVRNVVETNGGTLNIFPMERVFRVGITLKFQRNPGK